jgi:hypothetical protein
MDRSLIIRDLILKGLSKREIARRENISPNTVHYWTKKLNLKGKLDHDETGHKPPIHKDLIGKVYGYLLIEGFKQRGPKSAYNALCKCLLCGSHSEKNLPNILRGSITSCGCRKDQYEKMKGKNSAQFTGYEELTGNIWGKIKRRAIERGFPIQFDIKFAWDLFIKQNRKCALTGIDLKLGNKNRDITASLDRIDSNTGYIEENVQWVYKDINIMKNMFDQNYFIELCRLVTHKNKGIKYELPKTALFNRGRYITNKNTGIAPPCGK